MLARPQRKWQEKFSSTLVVFTFIARKSFDLANNGQQDGLFSIYIIFIQCCAPHLFTKRALQRRNVDTQCILQYLFPATRPTLHRTNPTSYCDPRKFKLAVCESNSLPALRTGKITQLSKAPFHCISFRLSFLIFTFCSKSLWTLQRKFSIVY